MPLEREASRVHDLEDDEEDVESTATTTPNRGDRASKRRRLEGGPFQPGSILRVSLKNFVTYTAAEFYPGPNMNLVIGPNGSGKSTIVCAICLGLGYPPSVLGRATALGDYVQHGKETAEIEIELADRDSRSIIIKRKLKKDKNQSTYYVNGKQDTLAKVQETMTRFNIQIDNLCQFLPQDKVASFAQLTPSQMLRETQRAVGGEEMVKHWERLCNLRKEAREVETALKNDTNQLTNLNQRQSALKLQVDRLHRRNEIITRIETLKLRIPIAKYLTAKSLYATIKERKKETKIRANQLKAESEPIRQRTDSYESRAKEIKRRQEEHQKSYERLKQKIRGHEGTVGRFEQIENDLRTEIRGIRKKAAERVGKLRALHQEIEKLEGTVRKCQERVDEIDPDKETTLKNQLKDIAEERQSLRPKASRVNAEGRRYAEEKQSVQERLTSTQKSLQDLTSVTQRRMEILRQRNPDAHEAVLWLQKEGHKRFKDEIFGPPILSVNIKDKAYAGQAEASFQANRDYYTFTCQSREDYKLFTKLVVDNSEKIFRKGLDLTVVEYSHTKQFKDWTPPCSSEKLRELGIDTWLLNLLSGPEPVLNTLCHSAKIHSIAISRRPLDARQTQAVENFTQQGPEGPMNVISAYIAGNVRYQITRSRYGKRAVSTISNQIGGRSDVFGDSIDVERKKDLERQIAEYKDQVRELEEVFRKSKDEEQQLRDRLQVLDDDKTALNGELQNLRKLYTDLESAQTRLAQQQNRKKIEEEKADTTEEDLARVEQKQQQTVMERVEHALTLEGYVRDAIQKAEDLTVWKIRSIQADADCQKVTAEAGQASQDLMEALAELGRLDNELKSKGDEAKKLHSELVESMREKGKTTEEMGDLVRDTPEDISVEALEAELEAEEANLRATQPTTTVGVMEMYERRAKEIQDIEERMTTRQTDMEQKTAEITHYRQIWEPRLQMLINRVSAAFGNAFASIGCAGDVILSKSGDPDNPTPTDDFEKWAIHIKVKFRDTEELQLLTGQRQSGGERSVSTIFYLMALQDMAQAPFRVVDEINQGMDPRNERLVHERMVDAACRPDTSQYFLITPKLLPGLKYHRNMKVLTINNGKFVPQTLDVGSYIERAGALQDISS